MVMKYVCVFLRVSLLYMYIYIHIYPSIDAYRKKKIKQHCWMLLVSEKNRYCNDNVNGEERSLLDHRPIINKLHRTMKKEQHDKTNCPLE